MPFALGTLKDRKIVQWAIAYLAGAWVLLQVVKLLSDTYAWPPAVTRVLPVVLGAGLLGLLILVWYHGEQGRQRVSGPELLILASLFLIGGGGTWLVGGRTSILSSSPVEAALALPTATPKSIAVLPFANLSTQQENEYLASGLQDEILMHLAKMGDLRVTSRTSVLSYAGTQKSLRQIGQELGVATILEGSLQRMGDRVRVTAQLIDARTDEHLWAEQYNRETTDLFAIQSEIAQAIVAALQVRLTVGERSNLTTAPTQSAAAYDLYLRAREYDVRSHQEQDVRAAESLYRRALELDPEFALAHARLAMTHARLLWYAFDRTDARREQALLHAETALRLQPDLPEAHLAMGYYHYRGRRDYAGALMELEIAARGLPSDADVHTAIAFVHRRQGRWEEALAGLQQAASLDPRNPDRAWELGTTYLTLRRYPLAAGAFDRAFELAPESYDFLLAKGEVFVRWQGTTDSLATALRRIPPAWDVNGVATLDRARLAWLQRRPEDGLAALEASDQEVFSNQTRYEPRALLRARAHDQLGDSARARADYHAARVLLETADAESPDDERIHIALAEVYAGLGRKQDAIQEARRAMELLPVSEDAYWGPGYMARTAGIFARVGEGDETLRVLERLFPIPSGISVALLRLEPTWDPLRSDPRFQRLLEATP